METSRIAGEESHTSRASTAACSAAIVWLGGHSSSGATATVSVGDVVSTIVTSTVSREARAPSLTSSSTEVRPSGKRPVGFDCVGSSNVTPGARHRKVSPAPSEVVPSSLTGVPDAPRGVHSTVVSFPACALTTPAAVTIVAA